MRCRSSLTWPKTKHEQLWLKKETWRRSRQIGRSELERIVASRTIIIYLFQHPPRSYWYIIIFVIPSNILSLILFEIRVQWGRLLSLSSTVRNLFASGSGPSGTSWTCRTTVRWVKKIDFYEHTVWKALYQTSRTWSTHFGMSQPDGKSSNYPMMLVFCDPPQCSLILLPMLPQLSW